jgi:hypothetical protein
MQSSPRWLDIARHRVKAFRAPYLLVVQHHDIPAATLLVAPVTPSRSGEVGILAPTLLINGAVHRARLLDIAPVPRQMIGATISAAEADPILGALDIILHGYPVGRPN